MRRNSRHGGILAGVLLMVLVLGILSIAALTTGLYCVDHLRVTDRDGDETTIETPFGSLHVRENSRFDPKHMGVPIYPGAVREDDSRKLASFRFDFGDVHKAFAVTAATYRTSDSVEQVTNFYRSELPHWLISTKDNGGLQMSFTRHGYKRLVAICEDDGQTRIALASVGEPASN